MMRQSNLHNVFMKIYKEALHLIELGLREIIIMRKLIRRHPTLHPST